MTLITNAFTTFSAVGDREDLSNRITNISPTDQPMMGLFGSTKASNRFHEWQTDALAAAAANTQLEGDAITAAAVVATGRLANSCQISYKTMAVSGSQNASDPAGRSVEFVYQTLKRTKELKRDMEYALSNNQTPVPTSHPNDPGGGTASTTTAAALRALNSWITTNDNRGTGGSDGSSSAGATDAAAANLQDLSEALLQTAIRQAYTAGGDPDAIIVGPRNKQKISGFAGNATRYIDAPARKLIAGIGYYESDFGIMKVVPSRFSRDRDCWVLQSSLWNVAMFRAITTKDLGRTGDADQGYVISEYTLESLSEAGNAGIFDLTTA
jgi:hypothetical protein